MTKIYLKYPTKIGKTLYPIGTELQVANIEAVRLVIPEIRQISYNDKSKQIAVVFPNGGYTILHIDQVTYEKNS